MPRGQLFVNIQDSKLGRTGSEGVDLSCSKNMREERAPPKKDSRPEGQDGAAVGGIIIFRRGEPLLIRSISKWICRLLMEGTPCK